MGELIHRAATAELRRFYVLHPTEVYVTLGVTVVTLVFGVVRFLCVIAQYAKVRRLVRTDGSRRERIKREERKGR
jgi:hypothetical protein